MMSKFPRPTFDPNAAYHAQMAARPSIQQQNDANAEFTDAQDPAARNWRTAHFGRVDASGSHGGSTAQGSPWAGYFDVLADRNAHLETPNVDLRSNLPAGYTAGAADQELESFANTGRVGGQGMQTPAFKGLEAASGARPQDRAKIAAGVRQQLLPGGRII